jgi:hypothetical protein
MENIFIGYALRNNMPLAEIILWSKLTPLKSPLVKGGLKGVEVVWRAINSEDSIVWSIL